MQLKKQIGEVRRKVEKLLEEMMDIHSISFWKNKWTTRRGFYYQ